MKFDFKVAMEMDLNQNRILNRTSQIPNRKS